MSSVKTPWTQEFVDQLNASQKDQRFHPYTCDGDEDGPRSDERHKAYAREHGGDWGQLVATVDGWVCPVCKYRQGWAHG